jgi:hypothetical protein
VGQWNYTELSAAIRNYSETEEPDFITNIPVFVQAAEQRIYNSVQLSYLRKNVTSTLTPNNKYLSSPQDFLSVYSIAVVGAGGSYEYLLNKDVNFIRQAYPSPTDTGVPKYYAIFGPTTTSDTPPVQTNELSFILGPTPNSNYPVELHYFYYPESIVTAGTTWLGDNFDTALLYGALREAAIFQRQEPDVVANYEQKYNETMTLLKQLGDGKERQDAYRTPQVRYPVG